MRKQIASLCVLVVFACFAIASKTSKMGWYGFADGRAVEEASPQGDYVELKDGTRTYGVKITSQSGLLLKDLVKVDGQKFKMGEVYGIRSGNTFKVLIGTNFAPRVVRGKINIYKLSITSQTYDTDAQGRGRWRTTTSTSYYGEKKGGELKQLTKIEHIQELVADCPAASAMANLSNKEMRRAIKKDREFLNNIIDVYNRGCKE